MVSFTIDTSCLMDLADSRPNAAHVKRLVEAHNNGSAGLTIAGSAVSERQRSGGYRPDAGEFRKQLDGLGLQGVPVLSPPMTWDVSYWDHGVLLGPEDIKLLHELHAIIHPNGNLDLAAYLAGPDENRTKEKWQNQLLDTQAMWCHLKAGNDVFVSNDEDAYHRQSRKGALLARGAKAIATPSDAASMLP